MKKQLWAPWRMEYVLHPGKDGCFFCKKRIEKKDKDNYILYRNKRSFVVLNIYPYTYGHLMVAPFRHVRYFSQLSDEDIFYFAKALQAAEGAIRRAVKPHGLNMGLNIGRVAGAGIRDHIHLHIVSRWKGDTNFMPVFSEIKILPERLDFTYEKLKPYFKEGKS